MSNNLMNIPILRMTLFFGTLCVLLTSGCSRILPGQPGSSEVTSITVMAAASLTEPFSEIGQVFEKEHPEVRVLFNFGGSQQLAQQLINHAGADVFASASTRYMDLVIENGLVSSDQGTVFVTNHLVVITPRMNPGNVTTLADLARPGLKLIIAAPEVPAGQYSLDFLEKAALSGLFDPGYKSAVIDNVVSYEENVKSVVTKVALGEADAGIVYSSDAAGIDPGGLLRVEIPDPLNIEAHYPIAVLKSSEHASIAEEFVNLVFSSEGQSILKHYGFTSVE